MTAPSSVHAFGTPVIGQTEKALNAILQRQLAGTGLTEPHWVTLTLAVVSGPTLPAKQLTDRVVGAAKLSEAAAAELVIDLDAFGLLRVASGGSVTVTDAGHKQWSAIRAAITTITDGLWGDLPAEELAIAARVLSTVLGRANALLAAA